MEKKKTETEMGGLREERFSGRGMENEGEGWRGVETIGGDCNASLFYTPYTKRPVILTIGMHQFETAFSITPCLYYIRRRGPEPG